MAAGSHCLAVLCLLLASGCSVRPAASDYPRTPSYTMTDTAGTTLGRAYGRAEKAHAGESGFHILPSGPEALMTRIALVQAAQKSIDMQYYSTEEDTTGKLFLEAILRAAARGVRVRMLLDDWNLDDFEKGAVALDANPHIAIRVFNPYSTRSQSWLERIGNVFSYLGPFTHRMHNKALIVDNEVAIMGGRNLGDEYFDAGKEMNFRDVDVFAAGPVTRRISANFDRYWNSDEAFPLAMLNLPPADADSTATMHQAMREHWQEIGRSAVGKRLNRLPLPLKAKNGGIPLVWAKAELAADNPVKVEQAGDDTTSMPAERIRQLADAAQHEFIIFTPYFVPLDEGVEWLTDMVRRGVRVRIVTNSLASTDVVPAQAGYGHYREALVKGGVELYELKSLLAKPPVKSMFKPSSQNGLHAKIYMVDRHDLVIGSFNLDPRSIKLNTEQVLVIHSPELGESVARLFEDVTSPASSYHVTQTEDGSLVWETEEGGKKATFDFNPHAGFVRRVTNALFSLLPLDDQL